MVNNWIDVGKLWSLPEMSWWTHEALFLKDATCVQHTTELFSDFNRMNAGEIKVEVDWVCSAENAVSDKM